MLNVDSSNFQLFLNAIDKNMLVLQTDILGTIEHVSDDFCHLCGYNRRELIGEKPSMLSSGFHTNDFFKKIWENLNSAKVWEGEIQNLSKEGESYWLHMTIFPLLNDSQELISYISISNNITKLKRANNHLNSIISGTNDIIYTLSDDGVFDFVTPSWTKLLGHELSEVVNHSFVPFVHPDDVPVCFEYLQKVLSKNIKNNEVVKYRVFHKDGGIRYHQTRATVLEETSSGIKFLAIARDITENVMQEEQIQAKNRELEKLAVTDYLTRLFNRVKIDEILKYELEQFKRYGNTFGVLMLDIDFFKNVNDTYGHQAGDEVLVELSKELLSHLRISDSLGRWGGEEFLIISPNIGEKGLLTQAENIRSAIESHKFKIGQLTVSIGVSLVKENDEIATLMQRADRALYDAKESGRNRICIR